MTASELKPCPFCGGKPWIHHNDAIDNWTIGCNACQVSHWWHTQIECIEKWNTRATPAPVVEVSDEMVDRALITWYGTPYPTTADSPSRDRADMRAALVAAFGRQS